MPELEDSDEPRISTILAGLARSGNGERLRLRDLTDALGGRALALLVLVFALPNAIGLGTIPGLSTVFGVPQIFMALQMTLGVRRPWLPAWLLDRSVKRADFVAMVDKTMPYLLKLERVLRERWRLVPATLVERLSGVVLLILAVLVALPIPFANQPPAAAAALMSIGLLAHDGLVVLLGFVAAAVAIAIAAAVVLGGAEAILLVTHRLFG